jgi:phosphoglycerate dehydrogenase-like enzyme
VYAPRSLPELLPAADVLVSCLPLTTRTEAIIGEAELALLPENALLVNVGRGAVVQEKALFNALRSGRLGGAGLDVWYQYPSEEARANTPPSAYPFGELDNVVLSPHRAGALGMGESELMRMDALAVSLNAAARGEGIPYRVDVVEGY